MIVMAQQIHGHAEVRKKLAHLVQTSTLPSSLMFAGPAGVGKRLVAYEVAQALLCERGEPMPGCGVCQGCQSVLRRQHPDLLTLECLSEDATVEAVRGLLHTLSLKPFCGGKRVIVINDADYLNLQGANALLKTLEEPMPGTHFLLVCANPSRLPATIRSRCHVWFFAALSRQDVGVVLKEIAARSSDLAAAPHEQLVAIADGSVDQIETLAQYVDQYAEVKGVISKVVSGDLAAGITFSTAVHKEKDLLRTYLRMIRIIARDAMCAERDPRRKSAFADCAENAITAEYMCFERNFNSQYVLSNLFQMLARGASVEQGVTGGSSLLLDEVIQ